MQFLSLHVKLRQLLAAGVLSVRQDPDSCHVFSGEGSYYHGNDRVEILADYSGKLPGSDGETLSTPHDVAWNPNSKELLAYSPSDTGPFTQMPDELKKIVLSFKKKTLSSAN